MIYSSRLGHIVIPSTSQSPFSEEKNRPIYAVYKALEDKDIVVSNAPTYQFCLVYFPDGDVVPFRDGFQSANKWRNCKEPPDIKDNNGNIVINEELQQWALTNLRKDNWTGVYPRPSLSSLRKM